MLLNDYISALKADGQAVECLNIPSAQKEIRSVTYNSKEAGEGTLFVCKGAAFKKEYLQEAVNAGACACVSETDYGLAGVPCVIVKDVRTAMQKIARLFYGAPEKKIRIIAVTGTKGKTTTCYLIRSIFDAWLEEKGEKPAAFLTSVETFDGKDLFPSRNTTPEIFESYGYLDSAIKNGSRYAVMEISSQGLKYGRVAGLKFKAGILLNLSPDHVSPIEHPDLEDYYSSKLMMFAQTENAIINMDSDYADEIIKAGALSGAVYTYGSYGHADYRISEVYEEDGHSFFTLSGEGKEYLFELGMRGTYNIENAAAAVIAGRLSGVPFELMQQVLKSVSIPGRGEEFSTEDGKVAVIVDYAHNELSCRKVIESAKSCWPDRKIITVFGCTGGKALNRRRGMGETISELSDRIYLTADDPGPEKVEDICREVAGYFRDCRYQTVPDREEAIRKAFSQIDGPSVLLLLGKGCETAQKVGKSSVPYPSDSVIAKECIMKYNTERTERI